MMRVKLRKKERIEIHRELNGFSGIKNTCLRPLNQYRKLLFRIKFEEIKNATELGLQLHETSTTFLQITGTDRFWRIKKPFFSKKFLNIVEWQR